MAVSEVQETDPVTAETTVISENCDDSRYSYYIVGSSYITGQSVIEYYVNMAALTVSGPNGGIQVVTVSGQRSFKVGTVPGEMYSVSSPGMNTSYWISK